MRYSVESLLSFLRAPGLFQLQSSMEVRVLLGEPVTLPVAPPVSSTAVLRVPLMLP